LRPGDRIGMAKLAIELRQHALDIRHDGLDLDDEERRRTRIPGQNVERAAFAE
jgi:hypothetical protein